MSSTLQLRSLVGLTVLLALGGCGRGNSEAGHDHDHGDHDHAAHGSATSPAKEPAPDDHDHDSHEAETPGHDGHVDHGDHDHGDHDHEDPAHDDGAAVVFREGQGLRVDAATADALGVKVAQVSKRDVTHVHAVTAAVFEAGPPARASALVPAEVADDLAAHPPEDVRLLAIHRDLQTVLSQVELVLELPGPQAAGTTVHLDLRGPTRLGVAVPRSAVLTTATGTFVYVVHGDYLRRTPVQPGAGDGDHLEIIDGLSAGHAVVTAAVEQLWLTELRLTKGGGHSH